ncbi:hypothetical protein EIP86_006529 [Pleurotus ostreatoroseus]|nr:hypothetical protein EIP86_006529 [Pleurotus ostreatoroseus]
MPFILRRARRTEMASSRSLMDVVKSKIAFGNNTHEKQELNIRECSSYNVQLPKPSGNLPERGYHQSRQHDGLYQASHRITQLPVELLAYIFVLGAEDDTRLPMVISHVCRAWRVVALNTPSLWRHVSLDSRNIMWHERIWRAKACTLDVELIPQAPAGRRAARRTYLDARSVESYMHLVTPYIPRWKSLRIEFQHYAPYLLSAALSACCAADEAVQAEMLENISLVHPQNDDSQEFFLFNGYAPRLRSVTLQGVRLAWTPSLFGNLSVLDYTHHGFTSGQDAFFELFGMLKVSSNLQELRLAFPPYAYRNLHFPDSEVPPKASIHLDKLQRLTLFVGADDIPSALLQLVSRLHMRDLRSLSLLATPPSLGPPQHRHYRELLKNLPPPFHRLRTFFKALPRLAQLSHFRIEHSWCDPSFVLGLLEFHVPQLKHLALASTHITDSFLWALGEKLRGRHYYVGHLDMQKQVPGVWHNGPVTLSTLETIEVSGAQISSEGLVSVVRRMLSGGIQWVDEVRIKDCAGVDSGVIERAGRFGVTVRVWIDDVEMHEGDDDSGLSRSKWKKLYK